MNKLISFAMLFALYGCKRQPSLTPEAKADRPTGQTRAPLPLLTAWTPITRGVAYQLSLKNGIFGFCDRVSGSQRLDLTTGHQSPGTEHCDWDHEEEQSSCDDYVIVSGPEGGGNDNIMVGNNNYVLSGHVHACDQQRQTRGCGNNGCCRASRRPERKGCNLRFGRR